MVAVATARRALDPAEPAFRRFLRGASWQALACEIAWTAVRRTGADHSCLDWLTGLVEAKLAEHVDRLASHLEGALVEGEPLWELPDVELGRAYSEITRWAVELLEPRPARR